MRDGSPVAPGDHVVEACAGRERSTYSIRARRRTARRDRHARRRNPRPSLHACREGDAIVLGEQLIVVRCLGLDGGARGLGVHTRRVHGADHVRLRAEVLDDLRLGAQPRTVLVPAGRELEVGRAHPDDQSAAVAERNGQRLSGESRRPIRDLSFDEVHGRRTDEARDEQVDGALVELLRRAALLEHAIAQHGYALAERHGLHLVVRHVDRRHAEPLVQLRELGAHRHAQLGVEVRERLVHQERCGLAHHRAAHRHPLALPAR